MWGRCVFVLRSSDLFSKRNSIVPSLILYDNIILYDIVIMLSIIVINP